MAKPIANEPGSAMHIHQSVVDINTGRNIFSDEKGDPTPEFFSFIAGHQKYLPAVMSILAPYVNSLYRRLTRDPMAPINLQWGYDNRTAGLRVPPSSPEARRLENRVPSSDANPYLVIAASLACGYLGIMEGLRATDPIESDAKNPGLRAAPWASGSGGRVRGLRAHRRGARPALATTYAAVKQAEPETFMRVISPWEREYLLLNV